MRRKRFSLAPCTLPEERLTMSWQTELKSWMFPSTLPTTDPPTVGQKVPQNEKLSIPSDGKPTIVTFLRHCGCPCAKHNLPFAMPYPADTRQSLKRHSSPSAQPPPHTLILTSSPCPTATAPPQTVGWKLSAAPTESKSLSIPTERAMQRGDSAYHPSGTF